MRASHVLDLARAVAPSRTRAPRGDGRSVVHLVPTMGWGGAERLACTMHRLARDAGLRSRIDAPSRPDVIAGLEAETGEAAAPRPNESSLRDWALAARARIAASPPDVVHAHLPYPDRVTAALLASAGAPVVLTFQLLPEAGRAWSLDEILPWRSDNTLRAIARARARARYVAVSADDAARLGALVPARALVRITNAPPLPRARAAATPAPPVAWPDGAVRLLSVGRLHAQKGFDRVARALAHPSLAQLPWHWHVAGRGPDERALRDAVAAAGIAHRVTLDLERPAAALYPTADVVLCPSRSEGMPLVPLEAIEAGVPVLASAIAPHRELFADAPDALLDDDEARWPPRLAALITDASARAALAARERATTPADPRGRMWAAYAKLYRELSRG